MTSTPVFRHHRSLFILVEFALIVSGCSGTEGATSPNSAGNDSMDTGGASSAQQSGGTTGVASGTGGMLGTGGNTMGIGGSSATGGVTGGSQNTGGASATGGAAVGGNTSTGGLPATGGKSSTGGVPATGGTAAAGGALATGGSQVTGGRATTGGTSATGGSKATGGTSATGGAATGGAATGGVAPTGGSKATGGAATGGAATGGTKATGGSAATGGSSGTSMCPTTTTGTCPTSLTCPTGANGTISCGCYLVNGLGATKKALLDAGASAMPYYIASAMIETETLLTSSYAQGDGKTGDSFNAGSCKQNWGMIRTCHTPWNGLGASSYLTSTAMNGDTATTRALDIQVYIECRNYYGANWWAGHRNGSSGLANPNTADIQNFKIGEDWTYQQLQNGHMCDNVRFWVSLPAIIIR